MLLKQSNRLNNKSKPLFFILMLVILFFIIGILYSKYIQHKKENFSFYEKLAYGVDVEILIVGDSIGEGYHASTPELGWANLLASQIRETYGVETILSNVSMGGNDSYAGYVRTMALNNDIDYDLVVLCYGQNDAVSNFGLYYEALIRAVRSEYPKASVISILESSQKEYTEKMQTIQSLAEHYKISVADTIAPFQEDYDAYTKDNVHPNDAGHRIYCEQIMNIIKPLVDAKEHFVSENIDFVDQRATSFENFCWYGTEQFTREGNTFTLNTSIKGDILGIDYNFVPGNNNCKILIDETEYAAPEVVFNYDFSQRHILPVNNWLNGDLVNVEKEIKIVFSEDNSGTMQADGFKGIAISGQ